MGFQLIFVVLVGREPGGVAVKRCEARHGDPYYPSNTRPLIRSEELIRSPRVASLASASSFKRRSVYRTSSAELASMKSRFRRIRNCVDFEFLGGAGERGLPLAARWMRSRSLSAKNGFERKLTGAGSLASNKAPRRLRDIIDNAQAIFR